MAASSAGCAWRATFASRPDARHSPASRVRARAFSPRSRASRSVPVLARASPRVAPPPPADKPRHNRRGDNAERDAFADELRERNSGGRVSKRLWRAHVGKLADPPAALADVTVILVGTKKAGNVGAVARACGSFECEDLRVVAPRADPYTRASLSAAKGAQHIVHGAGVYDTLDDALLDCGASVAFHVWCDGLNPERLRGIPHLLARFPGGVAGIPEPERDENGDAPNTSATNDDEKPRRTHPPGFEPTTNGTRRSRGPSRTRAGGACGDTSRPRPIAPIAARGNSRSCSAGRWRD